MTGFERKKLADCLTFLQAAIDKLQRTNGGARGPEIRKSVRRLELNFSALRKIQDEVASDADV